MAYRDGYQYRAYKQNINNKEDIRVIGTGGKDFMCDVSTKTIEDICQLLQCQPEDLIEWKVDLKPELAYENRFKE